MLYWLLVACWLYCGFQIVKNNGIKRLIYYFVGILFVPSTIGIIPQALLMEHTFYATMFILSMIRHREFTIQTFSDCPFSKSLFLVFLSCLLIGILDFRVGIAKGILRAVTVFIKTYFLFYVGWVSLSPLPSETYTEEEKDNHINEFFSLLLPITILITAYGFLTGITHTNPILDAVGLKDRFNLEDFNNYRSFRVTGACVSCSVYGLACSSLLMSAFLFIKEKTTTQKIALFLLLINIGLTATRAAIIPFLVGVCVFLILNKGLNSTLQTLLKAFVVVLVLFPILPESITGYVYQLFDSLVDAIFPSGTGGKKYGGSSIDARTMQIGAAMQMLAEKPFFGHGFAYFSEVLAHGKKHATLLGMESYLCFIGVEYGLCYLAAILTFFANAFIYFFMNRIYDYVLGDLGIALLSMFVLYLIFAWVGGSWFFFMPILGYVAKSLYVSKMQI